VARDRHPRERQAEKLARKKGKRPPYQRVLIVTEGEKTEPQYLDEIRKRERIPSAHVLVLDSQYGTQPRQIVDFAVDLFHERGGEFDRVFALFDRDEHRTYHDALDACRTIKLKNDHKKQVELRAIPSNPCFELWLLLHYEEIHHLHHRRDILEKLKRHIPGYQKASPGTYALTQAALADAITRAKRLQHRHRPEQDTDGPYTNVDVVVVLLRSMKDG
jgi:hypothetical protein